MIAPTALLAALQHGDTSFPGGGFAFSQGLEGLKAIRGRKPTSQELVTFIGEQLRHRWASADRVALALTFRAEQDDRRVTEIDCDLDHSTFCDTLRNGATRNGRALLSTHVRLGTPGVLRYREAVEAGTRPGTLACVQAVLWRAIGMDEATAVALSGYGVVAGSLASAVRLGLVGALGAQTLMGALLGEVAELAAVPVEDDAEICGFTPFLEIAAMRQARLPLRLFSN